MKYIADVQIDTLSVPSSFRSSLNCSGKSDDGGLAQKSLTIRRNDISLS